MNWQIAPKYKRRLRLAVGIARGALLCALACLELGSTVSAQENAGRPSQAAPAQRVSTAGSGRGSRHSTATDWLLLPALLRAGNEVPDLQATDAASPAWLGRLRESLNQTDTADLVDALEQDESSPRRRFDMPSVAQWVNRTETVLSALRAGRYGEAREWLLGAQGLGSQAVQEFGTQTRSDQQRVNACWLEVQGDLAEHARARAGQRAAGCKQLVPDIEPTLATLNPETIALTEMGSDANAVGRQSLSVRTEPADCCRVLVDGVDVGMSPARVDDLAPGRREVQIISLGYGRSRQHHLVLRRHQRARVLIHGRFDSALRTRPHPALVYPDAASRERYAESDAARTASAAGVTQVLLANVDGDSLQLQRLVFAPDSAGNELNGRVRTASIRVETNASIDILRSALRELQRAPLRDFR